MSKKHFKAIAESLLLNKPRIEPTAYRVLVRDIAYVCKMANANFDYARFYAACELDE